jgi:SAM-dependent methyltransferase
MSQELDYMRAFRKGSEAYDTKLGDWWIRKSRDTSHQNAYRRAAEYLEELTRRETKAPQRILDYACGNAALLPRLARRFPNAELIGVDGSLKMLQLAASELSALGLRGVSKNIASRKARGPTVRLIHSFLPNLRLFPHELDAVLFLFPNMNLSAKDISERIDESYTKREEEIARLLSRILLPGERKENIQSTFQDLLLFRLISKNIHRMLRKKGLWLKAEYCCIPRDQFDESDQWKLLFSESALDYEFGKRIIRDRFEYLGSKFFRSQVIKDVYEQTLDPADLHGGYFISAFRAR